MAARLWQGIHEPQNCGLDAALGFWCGRRDTAVAHRYIEEYRE